MDTNPSESDLPIISATDWINSLMQSGKKPKFRAPQGVILSYQKYLCDYAKRRGFRIQEKVFPGDFFLLNSPSSSIGLAANFGVGAPASVAQIELLAAFGVQEFISIGLAGSIQDSIEPGNLVICQRAIREEGTSRYYLKPGRFVSSSEELTRRLCHCLGENPYTLATSWTMDAPFRERRSRVNELKRCGITCVEMEAAAIFAAGQFLNKPVTAAFSISDILSTSPWKVHLDEGKSIMSLEILFDAAVQAFNPQERIN